MTTKHTPTPWRVDPSKPDDIYSECGAYVCVALDNEYSMIAADVPDAPDHATCEANAAFIVRAVNHHEAIVEMVRELTFIVEAIAPVRPSGADDLTERARTLLAALDAPEAA